MKEIPLTQGKVAFVSDKDYVYLNQWKWCVLHPGKNFYAVRRNPNQKTSLILMHRVVAKRKGMYINQKEIDRRDQNSLNNQRQNIRLANKKQQTANRGLIKTNTSGYKGVSWDKRDSVWTAQITVNDKTIHLGRFSRLNLKVAALAYNRAAIKYFGKFAFLNEV